MKLSPTLKALLAAILASITVVIVWPSGSSHPTQITITSANGKQVTAPASTVTSGDARQGPGQESVPDLKSSDRANPQAPQVNGPVPLASPFQRGCLTRSNHSNFSYRNGTKPSLILIHLPVAYNVPGWSDVNGVHIFLDRPSTAASVNYENDSEGHCIYSVAEVYKAWGQSNYNSQTACSIEQQGYGSERQFFAAPGLHQLAVIVHDCAQRWHISLQRAVVDGRGGVQREGVIDHFHLGPAGGGHVDIHGFGPACKQAGSRADTWACVDVIIHAARTLDAIPHSAQVACTELNTLRRHSRSYHKLYHLHPAPALTTTQHARARVLRHELRLFRCNVGAPGKKGTLRKR